MDSLTEAFSPRKRDRDRIVVEVPGSVLTAFVERESQRMGISKSKLVQFALEEIALSKDISNETGAYHDFLRAEQLWALEKRARRAKRIVSAKRRSARWFEQEVATTDWNDPEQVELLRDYFEKENEIRSYLRIGKLQFPERPAESRLMTVQRMREAGIVESDISRYLRLRDEHQPTEEFLQRLFDEAAARKEALAAIG